MSNRWVSWASESIVTVQKLMDYVIYVLPDLWLLGRKLVFAFLLESGEASSAISYDKHEKHEKTTQPRAHYLSAQSALLQNLSISMML